MTPNAKWIVSLLAALTILYLLVWVFVKVADTVTNEPPWITTTAMLVAMVPVLLLVSSAIAGVMTIKTFRATTQRKSIWKARWNYVELLWIVGNGLSIFSLLLTGANALRPIVSAELGQEAVEHEKEMFTEAHAIDEQYCPRLGDELCSQLARFRGRASTKDFPSDTYATLLESTLRYRKAHPKQEESALLGQLMSTWVSLGEDQKAAELEQRTIAAPPGAQWFVIAAPLIFAFAFPLRLGRALAAFAF